MAKTTIPKEQVQALIDAVPDVCDLRKLSYWVPVGELEVYIEGWCDKCLAGTIFTATGKGDRARKIEYMKDLTPEILKGQEEERGLKLISGGFTERENADSLYGVTYGIYSRRK